MSINMRPAHVRAAEPHPHIRGRRPESNPRPGLSTEGMAAVNTYRAEVTREDGWWMIRIPELDLLTQATSWSEVEMMARGVIVSDQDLEMTNVAVTIEATFDDESQRLLAEAEVKTAAAERLLAEAIQARKNAFRRLHSSGWSYRLIGKKTHLTHQRIEQLVKNDR